MLTQAIDYILVPDSTSARRLRRLISADSARLGLVVGTWSELVDMAARAYAIDAIIADEWSEKLQYGVANPEDAFWNKSFAVAPNEVIQYLDDSLQSLLHASTMATLNFSFAQLDNLNSRTKCHLTDLQRLHEQMGKILPAELDIIDQICRINVNNADFAIRLYRHQEIPRLTRKQTSLINKIESDFGTGSDASISEQLTTLFENNSAKSSALRHLQEQLFATDVQPIALDSSLQWLAVRDYREEIEVAVSMVQQMIASDSTLTFADIGILLPDNPEYRATLIDMLDKAKIPYSGLSNNHSLRDLGYELIRDFLVVLQPPPPSMALASLFSSPLLPWSSTTGNRLAQSIMDGNGYSEDNPIAVLIAETAVTTDEVTEKLKKLLDLLTVRNDTALHLGRAKQLVTELLAILVDCDHVDWTQLERLSTPQQLSNNSSPTYYQEGVGIFLATKEPWHNCRNLLVLGLTAGNYPTPPAESPVFLQHDIHAINASLDIDLVDNQQLLLQRRNLFKRQLQSATDEITLLVPRRDGCGAPLSFSESLIFMAQLFTDIENAEELLLFVDSESDRTKIRHLAFDEIEIQPPSISATTDLELDCNLLTLRTDAHGNQKPESPSGLETLMVSPLAWLLRRYHMEEKEWSIDTLDAMTRGTLAHRVFEQLFATDKPLPDAMSITTQLPKLLQTAIDETFPLLQCDEWRIEHRNLQREIEMAAKHWGNMLTGMDATIVGVEEHLSGFLDKLPLRGFADLLLQLPHGKMLVVDYKKAKSAARIKRMDKGYDSQANLYRIMLETGDTKYENKQLEQVLIETVDIGAMYYLMNDQTALSDTTNWTQGDIAGWHEEGPDISCYAMELIRERIEQLERGQIVLNNVDEENSLEKETGMKPYAFDDSPLVRLFMKPVK